jgi:hypothetical protein
MQLPLLLLLWRAAAFFQLPACSCSLVFSISLSGRQTSGPPPLLLPPRH